MKRFLILLGGLVIMAAQLNAAQAIFAGGCFWCVQADFDKLKGVQKTVVGFDGGTSPNPTYKQVSAGGTGYAEAVQITYNPQEISYAQLVDYLFHHIDPTVKDAQFCDHGHQYRSAIFYLNDEQKRVALAAVEKYKKRFGQVYTEVTPSTQFYPAEAYHQEYYKKNPIRYKFYRWNCGRDKRVEKVWGDKNK